MAKKLELNKETLRNLSDESLTDVAGGASPITSTCPLTTQTPVCPSGATWFTDCESTWVHCG
ncbi:MAG: class I lanthipeptide [Actinomycetota bacterium]|nr:class I lanthipeptide [Actinomycetota bacterium]